MTTNPYNICSRCIMDTTASDISFNEYGICNFCTDFLTQKSHVLHKCPKQRKKELNTLISRIKASGKSKRYDCVLGVSGGVDSSWALVQAVKQGLNPLAVHMDNGWDSELAQNNIFNLVRGLGVDLYTYVIDWDEYRSLMQSFFDADVIDVELLYDNAMLAVNFQQAAKQGIKFILAGYNQSTEGMRIPIDWNWFKYDKRNIKEIAWKFGKIKLKSFPAVGTLDFIRYRSLYRIKWISFLDYFDYNKLDALNVLQQDFNYKPYPYKHYESIFTRFYQGYILPQKFGVDKRKIHLSNLVASGQMARDVALNEMKGFPYPSNRNLEEDKTYFIKKMGWSEDQLHDYLKRPRISHMTYPSEKLLWNLLIGTYKRFVKPSKC